VGQGLYQSLELPLPTKPTSEKPILLIYGGSTATGSLAIQYAKLSGFLVATTCSEHNFQYLKSLRAGKSLKVPPELKHHSHNKPQTQPSTTNRRPAQKTSKNGPTTPSPSHSTASPKVPPPPSPSPPCPPPAVSTPPSSRSSPKPFRK
jgi:hypothetical protein